MYNLFRKSLRILAGLGLLFLYNCTTVEIPSNIEQQSYDMTTIFSSERESILYISRAENTDLIESLAEELYLDRRSIAMIEKSRDLFLAFSGSPTDGMDAVIRGDFSKRQLEFGLFLSFDWKKQNRDGYGYWVSRDGIELYIVNNQTIVISTTDLLPIINRVEGSIIDAPIESIVLMMPEMDEEQNKKLSNGFIKGGILSLAIYLDREEDTYSLDAVLGLESPSKARAFSRLINIFLKMLMSASNDPDIGKINEKFEIEAENSKVLVGNISLNDKILKDFINNIIFLEREADK